MNNVDELHSRVSGAIWRAEQAEEHGLGSAAGEWAAVSSLEEKLAGIITDTDFLKKVYDSADFKKYLAEGALKPAFATGSEYVKWVEENEQLHKDLMAKGGLLKK